MSKIKKALEKIKSQTKALKPDQSDNPKEYKEKPATSEIVYTRTKVIKVNPEDIKKNKIIVIDENNPITDQFKLLRTRILSKTRANGLRTIQVSGFGTKEGKSLVASNLAIVMAKETRQTTLLVDFDFRNPSIHKLFCLGDVKGLKDYFENNVPLEELFINPGISKLTILPAGGRLINAPEIMGSPKMEALVKELKERYPDRYIIIDTPGMSICPDPHILLEYVDALLLITRSGVTDKDTIESVMKIIPKEKLLGVVLNDSELISDHLKYGVHYG